MKFNCTFNIRYYFLLNDIMFHWMDHPLCDKSRATFTTAVFSVPFICLRALQLLTLVEWSMLPPLQMGRCELGVSENNYLISDFVATTTITVAVM